MCEVHNKLSLRHIAEIDPCDDFCGSYDPCELVEQAVRQCKDCSPGVNPADTHRFQWDSENFLDIETGEPVPYEEVKKYCLK